MANHLQFHCSFSLVDELHEIHLVTVSTTKNTNKHCATAKMMLLDVIPYLKKHETISHQMM